MSILTPIVLIALLVKLWSNIMVSIKERKGETVAADMVGLIAFYFESEMKYVLWRSYGAEISETAGDFESETVRRFGCQQGGRQGGRR